MAFKKLINSKTILSFFAAFMLFGTNMVMAQTAAAGTGEDANQVNWTSISYYVLIFFLICLGVAVIGKIL